MTQDILNRLSAVSGSHWSAEPPRRHNPDLSEYKLFTSRGAIITVICAPVAEDMPPCWSWTFFDTIDDEQAPLGVNDRRYLPLQAGGFADTLEDAATAALAYQPEEREMLGIRWYGTVNGHHAHSGQSWIAAIAGAAVEIRSSSSTDGYSWTHPLPELAPLVHMIKDAWAHEPSLAGKSPTVEGAAADAIAAPGRLRQVIAAIAGAQDYQRGFDDGGRAVVSQIVKNCFGPTPPQVGIEGKNFAAPFYAQFEAETRG